MSNVRSAKLRSGPAVQWGRVGGSGVGVVISAVLWLLGARFTIDGVIWIANALLAFFNVPTAIATPLPWFVYAILTPIPVLFSVVEWYNLPFWWDENGLLCWNTPGMIVVWLVVYAMDGVTTYLGLRHPDPQSAEIMRQIAENIYLSGGITAVLTIGPEALLRSMVWVMRNAFGRGKTR